MNDFYTPHYESLDRELLVLGTTNRTLSIEGMLIGFSLFVIHSYLFAGYILLIHTIIAILNCKEREWIEILKFSLKISGKENAELP